MRIFFRFGTEHRDLPQIDINDVDLLFVFANSVIEWPFVVFVAGTSARVTRGIFVNSFGVGFRVELYEAAFADVYFA